MDQRIVYDLQNMLIVGSLLCSSLLMTLYWSYTWAKLKPTYESKKYLTGQMMIILWSVFLLFEVIAPKSELEALFSYLKEGMICILGFIIIRMLQTYYKGSPLIKKFILWMSGVPSITLLIFIINNQTSAHVLSATINLLYFLCGLFYYLKVELQNKGRMSMRQIHFVVTLIAFPFYGYLVYYLDALDIKVEKLIYWMPGYLLIMVGLSMKRKLFDDLPLVLEAVLQNVNYGIIVVDNKLEILSLNRTFFKQFIEIDENNCFVNFIEQLTKVATNKLSVDNILVAVKTFGKKIITGEFKLDIEGRRVEFTYTISSICDTYQKQIATMVTISDVTQITYLQRDIENKNIQLLEANEKLKEHMENLKELTVEKERDALMTEINDTFGHSMTEMLVLLEVCSLLIDQEDEEKVVNAISDTITRARDALEEMRQSVTKYKKGVSSDD